MTYLDAKECYAAYGIDTDVAIRTLAALPLSLHVWQGDDVRGFEPSVGELAGSGLAVTGAHSGRARTPAELRQDLSFVLSLLPGTQRVNLHAIYADYAGRSVERDALTSELFAEWIAWARTQGVGLDFNATCFAHPFAADGLTLSHPDEKIRRFWIRHVQACRRIAGTFARELGKGSVHNLWIPDGMKDLTASRLARRRTLLESLDAIYAETVPDLTDSVESKLFGIGSEAFVVGSHEFYMGYAMRRGLHLCLDLGHFHPTESVADKVSALLPFVPGLLIHASRGLRWDSDHVVLLDDNLQSLCNEIVAAEALPRVAFALDYFDASINRVGAWALGARATRLALLRALLTPWAAIRAAEQAGDGFAKLALIEESKALPWNVVWEEVLRRAGAPAGAQLREAIAAYTASALDARR